MTKLILSALLFISFNSSAQTADSLKGQFEQKTQISLKTRKGIKKLSSTNIINVQKLDENTSRVKLDIVENQGSTCSLDEEFLKNGDTLVFTKNSTSGRGTCEITVSNFRNRGLLIFENKDKGDCTDFCSQGSKIGVRLFDKVK